MTIDSFSVKDTLFVGGRQYEYMSLAKAEQNGLAGVSTLPFSLKILMENLLRHEDDVTVKRSHIESLANWPQGCADGIEIAYRPGRVIMPDSSGIPLLADLAAMREAIHDLGGDVRAVNPVSAIDLVVDHSISAEFAGTADALRRNIELEYARNAERYAFLRWVERAFENIRIIPPGQGIIHQVNIEYLAQVISTREQDGKAWAYPDCVLGMDSHTPMVNGMGVLGWGCGGIEAGAAILGQPVTLLVPGVVGVVLTGRLREGVTATDLVLTITERLRAKGVVQKFVEFCGPALSELPLADRTTIANMSPEFGATASYFPIDAETIAYMRGTGREEAHLEFDESYARAQGLWRDDHSPVPRYSEKVEIDLNEIEPCVAGPHRPQDRVPLAQIRDSLNSALAAHLSEVERARRFHLPKFGADVGHGALAVAAITSCTNTSHPGSMVAAGLLARNAVRAGLRSRPWVKTSLAPGSKVVAAYFDRSELQADLDKLGFQVVGFGCTTCMGNSGPIDSEMAQAVDNEGLIAGAVLSGNRNFEGRVHPKTRVNYLASPPLVVAFALAGTLDIDLLRDPLGHRPDGTPVYLHDIWPSNEEITRIVTKEVSSDLYSKEYKDIFAGDKHWQGLPVSDGDTFDWPSDSLFMRRPPFFEDTRPQPAQIDDIIGARPLAIFGDSITTDHISPVGTIQPDSPAGQYLTGLGVSERDYHSYAGRRVNHDVMIRGTFANIRLKNELVTGTEGGFTRHFPSGEAVTIFEASQRYAAEKTPLVIVAGQEYGAGSSRDWAAKGTRLLGVRAVIAEGFERIHRSNLLGMGVLPLQFEPGVDRHSLGLDGSETFDVLGLSSLRPRGEVDCIIRGHGKERDIKLICRLDTEREIQYFRNGGILHFVLRELLRAA